MVKHCSMCKKGDISAFFIWFILFCTYLQCFKPEKSWWTAHGAPSGYKQSNWEKSGLLLELNIFTFLDFQLVFGLQMFSFPLVGKNKT